MKIAMAILSLAALAAAKPSGIVTPYVASFNYAAPTAPFVAIAPIAVNEISSQYHAQDTLGQYSYGYASSLGSKTEFKTLDGITRGGYAYVDAEGKLQSASYVADPLNGFRVAATNIPVGPTENVAPVELAPKQVADTPEVSAAKAAHLAAIEEAKARVAAANAAEAEARTAVANAAEAAHNEALAKIAAIPAIHTVPGAGIVLPSRFTSIAPLSVGAPAVIEAKSAVSTETKESAAEKTTEAAKEKTAEETTETKAESKSSDSVEVTAAGFPAGVSGFSTIGAIAAPQYFYSNVIATHHQPAALLSPSLVIPNSISSYSFQAPALKLVSTIPALQTVSAVEGSKSTSDSVEIVAAKSSEKITAASSSK